jgi:hypothetical protein
MPVPCCYVRGPDRPDRRAERVFPTGQGPGWWDHWWSRSTTRCRSCWARCSVRHRPAGPPGGGARRPALGVHRSPHPGRHRRRGRVADRQGQGPGAPARVAHAPRCGRVGSPVADHRPQDAYRPGRQRHGRHPDHRALGQAGRGGDVQEGFRGSSPGRVVRQHRRVPGHAATTRNAGSNTVADHIRGHTDAIAQLPPDRRSKILVRIDGAGATHDLLAHLPGSTPAAAWSGSPLAGPSPTPTRPRSPPYPKPPGSTRSTKTVSPPTPPASPS